MLMKQRDALEDAYRVFAGEECGLEEDVSNAKIEKARLVPQQNQRLQAIHEAHKAVLSKEAAIKDAGVEDNPEDEARIRARAHAHTHTRVCIHVHARTQAGLCLQFVFGTVLRNRARGMYDQNPTARGGVGDAGQGLDLCWRSVLSFKLEIKTTKS